MQAWPIAFMALTLMSMSAFAEDADWASCVSSDAARAIDGCTRVLNRGTRISLADRVTAFVDRGEAYRQKGDYDRAIADDNEAIRLDSHNAVAFKNRGYAYRQKGDNDRAIADYSEAIRIKPDDANAIKKRGYAYHQEGDNDRAIADYSEAIRIKPDDANAFNIRANAYYEKGDNDHAIADYNEAFRLKPGDSNDFNSRGTAYFENGDYGRAISDFGEALRLDPKNANALNSRGNALVEKRDFDAAIQDLDQAIQLDPMYANPHAHRARAYLGKDDTARALADAEEAIRLNPKYARGYEARGEVREKNGDYRGALDDYNQALTLTSDGAGSALASAGRDRVLTALSIPSSTPLAIASPIAPQPQAAEPIGRRVALVVANGAYRDAPLANPSFDATLVAASLEKIGFSVVVKKDLALDAFEQAISDFADASRGAEIALFYFAGHGFSVTASGRQQNLLMATNADFQAKTAFGLQSGGEPIEHIEETIIGHAHATLIFVDACRNVPALASRGVGARGFAPIDASAFEGAFVVVSTRQGRTAADGAEGQGSPFARAFAAVVPTSHLRIEDVYARIRERVRAETSGEQVPDAIRSDLPEGGVVLTNAAP